MTARSPHTTADGDSHAADGHDHACLIYETPAERVASTVAWAGRAVRRHERFLYLANDEMRRETVAGMRAVGLAPDRLQTGHAVFVTERAPFCEDGLFTAQRMISFVEREIARALADGFAGLRAAGEMTWILGNELETMRVLECESRLNESLPSVPAEVLCQWDRTAFEPMIVLEALHTHPVVMVGDEVFDNTAYYVPTAEYLASRSAAEQLDRQLGVLKGLEDMRRAALSAQDPPSARRVV